MLTVTCRDIGRLFDRWRVTKTLSYLSLGSLIKSIVEDPTGHTATGITAHCEEIPTDIGVVTIASFVGAAKTLSACSPTSPQRPGTPGRSLTRMGAGTSGGLTRDANPPSPSRLRTTPTALLIPHPVANRDEVRVTKDRSQYANRVVFSGIPDPPPVPGNGADSTRYSQSRPQAGRHGVYLHRSRQHLQGQRGEERQPRPRGSTPLPRLHPLAYVRVPAELQDMTQGKSYGYLRADIRMTIGESAPFYSSFTGVKPNATSPPTWST
jgi:hypothetical protein